MSASKVSTIIHDVREMAIEREKARTIFSRNGISLTQWSLDRRYNPAVVRGVLDGNFACLRGQAHKIAVELGIKPASDAACEPSGKAIDEGAAV